MKIRSIITVASALLLSVGSFAQTKPKLVVNIVVGQMRYDYLIRFRDNFSDKGFRMMVDQGVSCDRAMYNYLTTSTPSGLSTISTGTNPSTHGIIGSCWYNYLTQEQIKVAFDPNSKTVGSDELDAQVSPSGLIAGTLGDGLKSISPLSKVINIAFEPLSAVVIGGHTADASYWVSPREGNIVTSTYYMTKLPDWVNQFNQLKAAENYSAEKWVIMLKSDKYHNIFRKDIQLEDDNSLNFDFLTRKKYEYERLGASPFGNTLLNDFAKQAVIYENLGKDANTDLLNIVLDPTRLVGEKYGSQSIEIEDTYYRLDKELGDLIEFLNSQVGKDNLLIVLTSDHGAVDPVIESSKVPSGRFNKEQFVMLMNGFIGGILGSGERWILDYSDNQIFLNRRLFYEKEIKLEDIQAKLATFAIQFRGVAHAITANSLSSSHFSGGIMNKAQNSYYQRHSGDVIINYLPGWSEDNAKLSDSGTSYNYDTHVPLIWYGSGIGTHNIARDVDMTDVAPTMAHIMQITPPFASTGKPIIEIYENEQK